MVVRTDIPRIVGPGLFLTALNPLQSSLEGDSGQLTNISFCFAVFIPQPLGRFALFRTLLDGTLSTAILELDYTLTREAQFLAIPPDAGSMFETCLELVVIGDDEFEDDEFVVSLLSPLSESDSILSISDLTLVILNDDGKNKNNCLV